MKEYLTYADAAGVITITEQPADNPKAPDGTLPIAKHVDRGRLEQVVSVVARHAHDNETLLVPGIPEAATQTDALEALLRFRQHVTRRLERSQSQNDGAEG